MDLEELENRISSSVLTNAELLERSHTPIIYTLPPLAAALSGNGGSHTIIHASPNFSVYKSTSDIKNMEIPEEFPCLRQCLTDYIFKEYGEQVKDKRICRLYELLIKLKLERLE